MKLGKYRHFKGGLYEVIGIGLFSETKEELVVYKALYEGEYPYGQLWVRPQKMFTEIIKRGNIETLRFEYIEEN